MVPFPQTFPVPMPVNTAVLFPLTSAVPLPFTLTDPLPLTLTVLSPWTTALAFPLTTTCSPPLMVTEALPLTTTYPPLTTADLFPLTRTGVPEPTGCLDIPTESGERTLRVGVVVTPHHRQAPSVLPHQRAIVPRRPAPGVLMLVHQAQSVLELVENVGLNLVARRFLRMHPGVHVEPHGSLPGVPLSLAPNVGG